MSRGQLDEETNNDIARTIPDIRELYNLGLPFNPSPLSAFLGPKSKLPVAAVCLEDVIDTFHAAGYALLEAQAHLMWYREKSTPPSELLATFYGKFYIDDVAIRLYSAAEHLANAIVHMLGIGKRQLKPYRNSQTSMAAAVGKYLTAKKPNDSITKAISKLVESQEWNSLTHYRNKWTHDQPPMVAGLGIVYERKNRWTRVGDSEWYKTGGGGGDKPEHSIDELVSSSQKALRAFHETVKTVTEQFVDLLSNEGVGIEVKDGESTATKTVAIFRQNACH